ncbi:MAG: sigma-54 dependent transcriptional regulator [Candidatus Omnitrophota bacterium]
MKQDRILVVDDEPGMRQYLKKLLTDNGYQVEIAENGIQALEMINEKVLDLALIDFKMPGMDGIQLLAKIKAEHEHVIVIMMTAYGTMERAIQAMKLGAYDYLSKPFEVDAILLIIEKALKTKRLEDENIILRKELKKTYTFADIISENSQMQHIFEIIQKVAPAKSTVLIQGETGTGKELIARALHALSPRNQKPFIPVDCGALSESLLESELFGHIKGAFTGATQDKKGLFETADGGTVFLDEIGHISLAIQAKLLRVLQDGQIKRVGEAASRSVDIRLVAASNEDIEMGIKEGKFREDLFYRLNVVPIFVPALRERNEDIPLLVEHFIHKYNNIEKRNIQGISHDALKMLMSFSWPGNVRELENLVHRAVVMADKDNIEVMDLPLNVKTLSVAERRIDANRTLDFRKAKNNALAAFEKRFLIESLMRHKGNISRAAKEMNLDRRNLHRKLKQYNITPSNYLS